MVMNNSLAEVHLFLGIGFLHTISCSVPDLDCKSVCILQGSVKSIQRQELRYDDIKQDMLNIVLIGLAKSYLVRMKSMNYIVC